MWSLIKRKWKILLLVISMFLGFFLLDLKVVLSDMLFNISENKLNDEDFE